jgi:hypothetical protein
MDALYEPLVVIALFVGGGYVAYMVLIDPLRRRHVSTFGSGRCSVKLTAVGDGLVRGE